MVEERMGILSAESLQIHSILRQRAGLPDMAFIQMIYVALIVVSMFRLKHIVEFFTMGNTKLIHSLTTHMKGGFSILLEKKKAD